MGVSRVMHAQGRSGIDWNALIADPDADGATGVPAAALDDHERPFALIGTRVLRRLGGTWLKCADRLADL